MANNKVAYGLAKEYGIDTTGMTPKEVWDALNEKGITQSNSGEKSKEVKDLQSKSTDELKEMATVDISKKTESNKTEIVNVLKNADINFVKWEPGNEAGSAGINFYFKDEQSKDKAYRNLAPMLDRDIRNYKDYLFVPIETRSEAKTRLDSEKEEYVKKAIESGKYKGTNEEIAKMIFMDSPYSIHSAEQIKSLVKKLI
jgi:hypothetical protein